VNDVGGAKSFRLVSCFLVEDTEIWCYSTDPWVQWSAAVLGAELMTALVGFAFFR